MVIIAVFVSIIFLVSFALFYYYYYYFNEFIGSSSRQNRRCTYLAIFSSRSISVENQNKGICLTCRMVLNGFQMTVESNYAIAIDKLCDWLKYVTGNCHEF